MVVDYSKWDKLELSDDSDVEVHPNVDKRSFIRMKQRQIHEQRAQLKHNMTQLEVSLEMNNDLVTRIQQMIDAGKAGESLQEIPQAVAISERGSEHKKHPNSETSPDAPQYNDMIESLMDKIAGEVEKSTDKQTAIIEKLAEHLVKLREIIAGQQSQYDEFKEERSRHILSEDIHTGFDSTFVVKNADEKPTSSTTAAAEKPTKTTTAKETEIEVINPSNTSTGTTKASAIEDDDDDDDEAALSDEALRYVQLPTDNLEKHFSFLSRFRHLLNEHEKDSMMMFAFQEQLAGKTAEMKRTVYNAKIVEYCLTLGPDGMRMFFTNAVKPNSPVLDALQKDVDLVVNHIIERCKVISQEREEQAEEPQELIQLHAVDPDTEITVTIPDENSPEQARQVYDGFSQEMRDAIATRQLDEINKVLAKMSVEDAEDMIRKFDECGMLQVEEKIYDASEWQQKKQELEQEHDQQQEEADDEKDNETKPSSTIEELD